MGSRWFPVILSTLVALVLLPAACAPATPPAPPTPAPSILALAPSPTPTRTATPTTTSTPPPTVISSGGSVTPTREPTMTPWPTYTASPTRTATPTPTPLPQLPAWLYPTDPHARELFEQVRRAHDRLIQTVQSGNNYIPLTDSDRVCGDLRRAAEAYLAEFPDTIAAAAVYAMTGAINATRWYMAGRGAPLSRPDLYVSFQHNEDYDRAIELYLAHSKDLDVPPMIGLEAIGLFVAWSQEADVGGDARPDVLLGLDPWRGYPESTFEYLYVLCASDQGGFVPHQILTEYVNGEGEKKGHGVEKIEIGDVNQDGRNEIIVQNVYIYAGGPGLYVNVFQWQEDDFANVLDWEGRDLYYGHLRMRELAESGTTELILNAGKARPEWAFQLPKTFYYQWDGQRYTCQLPLCYSEYYDHAKENGHYYFFEQRDYARALAEYEIALARYRVQYGQEYEQVDDYDPYLTPWCHINIVVCHKALGDEVRFQEAYAAFREQYPKWRRTLDEQLLQLKADNQDPGLKHVWHDGATWHVETVPTGSGNLGGGIGLAVDAAGRPHLAYHDYVNDELKYSWHDGTAWHVETVAEELYLVFVCPSLALDGAGRPHLSYTHSGVQYAWRDDLTWHVRGVGGLGYVGSHIVLDQAGRPHIGYDSTNPDLASNLKYAWYDGADWQVEIVDSGASLHLSDLALALDGTDHPHLVYHCYTSGELEYAWRGGTAWHTETVPTSSQQENMSFALAVDAASRPHVVYYDASSDALKHTWRDGTTWRVETVGSTGDVGSISLIVDEAGHPHIGYYDHTHGDVEYAWHDGTAWHVETVASPGIVRSNVVLALDGAGHPHIGYYSEAGDE